MPALVSSATLCCCCLPHPLPALSTGQIVFSKTKEWRDAAAKERYERARQEFVDANKRDSHYDLVESWGIDGFRQNMLVTRPGEKLPFWVSWYVAPTAPSPALPARGRF